MTTSRRPLSTTAMPPMVSLALLVGLGGVLGCTSATRIVVRSSQDTNAGSTLYMMVRDMAGAKIASERYQDAAQRPFSLEPDPSVIATQPIIPGETVTVPIDESTTKGVVLYFFFSQPPATQPDIRWRVPLPLPLPEEVLVDLGKNEVSRVQIRKR